MTEQDIAEMPAGRELDIMIAERVMGQRIASVVPYPTMHVDDEIEVLPNYSTDVSAAWDVVAVMLAKGWTWESLGSGYGYRAHFYKLPLSLTASANWDAIVNGTTIALAICRAAIARVGQ